MNWLILVPVICAATVFMLTRKSKKEYSSSTTLYTGVASGYSITSTEDERLDYFAVNNAFDNMLASAKSRETIAQVALHLLAEHLSLRKPDVKVLSPDGFENLHKMAGKALLNTAAKLRTPQAIYNYINQVYAAKQGNVIAYILNQPGSYYNIDDLKSNLVVTRISTSDIIQIVYGCTDAAVCQRVLQIHIEIFLANYKRLKTDQTNSAVQYFEAKLAEAKAKLKKSEDDMRIFGQQNHIINYYEQTRYIAEENEQLNREIYGQKIAKTGADNALALVKNKLSTRDKQIANGTSIINLRQQLSDANTALERAKVFGNTEKISQITARTRILEDSIKSASADYDNLNYSLETIPRTSLIKEWVDNAVSSGNAKAGLNVLNNQKRDYLKNFDEFAPLGSTLKRLERQIDINEKEFLSILHGLNLARLRQSNIALNSNIVVQDAPFLPLKAQKSTRALLVMLSFVVGFILVGSVIIGRELMDSSIRTPDRAKKLINLPLAGISIATNSSKPKTYVQALRHLLAEQFISGLLPALNEAVTAHGTAQITLLQTKTGLFNAEDIKLTDGMLSQLFDSVHWVIPSGKQAAFATALPQGKYSIYEPAIAHLNYIDVAQLVDTTLSAYKLIIYVAPNPAQHSLPAAIVKNSAVNLLMVNANDTWLPVDKDLLIKLKTMLAGANLCTWLVNADENNLDSIIGEVPKERSWLRKKIKKVITLNLR
ncbi:GumC family protein [Mucilaginibacter psychrotolerans]|uniref:Tyrosine kinase G-rich domain-containing protein n=1 Tax=Mucilaginibacter psychrotolerans TaxID=1524096 RepID=A0A4Y8S6Z9_9SPHI|nr:hypothetical protein [Mucilaginibacter psychrotolerans]TFF34728.1 hypothetical protein E2R66_21000 [Mucilaginibacter psychrotolerans]